MAYTETFPRANFLLCSLAMPHLMVPFS